MVTPQKPAVTSPADDGSSDLTEAEERTEALEVVEDALEWRLHPCHWERIAPIVAALIEALEHGDRQALVTATADLELAGPLRITRIGDDPLLPPPPAVRDRLNRLIHTLGGLAPPDGSTTADEDDPMRSISSRPPPETA
jgi:hypothetical protein